MNESASLTPVQGPSTGKRKPNVHAHDKKHQLVPQWVCQLQIHQGKGSLQMRLQHLPHTTHQK